MICHSKIALHLKLFKNSEVELIAHHREGFLWQDKLCCSRKDEVVDLPAPWWYLAVPV